MKRQGIFQHWIARAAFLPALVLALSAQAQPAGSVNDFQLPPGDVPQPPPSAGPVDPEQPVPARSDPAPSPRPEANPPPVVATQLSPPPADLPPSRGVVANSVPSSLTARQVPRPEASVRQRDAAASIPPAPEPYSKAPAIHSRGTPPSPAIGPEQVPPALASASTRFDWAWWLLGGVVLAFFLIGILFGLRGRAREEAAEIDAEREASPPSDWEDPSVPPQEPVIAPTVRPSQVELAFEPECLTMALVNARLAYRLSLTNAGDLPVGPVIIACDILSAHASITDRDQLRFGGEGVEPTHQLPSLASGETVSLAGELQLPIAAILPVRSGGASLFVPLARFRVTALGEGRPPQVSTRIFVIGESPEQPGRRLKPIRIDVGPRTFSRISQREIKAAA